VLHRLQCRRIEFEGLPNNLVPSHVSDYDDGKCACKLCCTNIWLTILFQTTVSWFNELHKMKTTLFFFPTSISPPNSLLVTRHSPLAT
jgi:hypothetical protein